MHDIIIVGAGPAGLTAAIYALRADKKVLLIEKDTFGGQITFSPKVENIPGFEAVSGNEFADKLLEQALSQGADIHPAKVTEVKDNGKTKTVITDDGEVFEAKAVIIAVGVCHRMPGLDGEDALVGNGISFCAVCDGAFYKDKTVAVMGGGNSALQEAILLSDTAKKVYVVQDLEKFTGEARLVENLTSRENVECMMGSSVTGLLSEDGLLTGITVSSSGVERRLDVDGMFVAIGLIPENGVFEHLAGLDARGYFDSGEDCRTMTEGVFVAGDCRSKKVRQVTTACADGAVAAIAACEFIDRM